jgi:DNA invertase Pin-like site-specific DNA recombinase
MTAHLTDPQPLINPQQAAWDRRKFMAKHGNTATPEEIEREIRFGADESTASDVARMRAEGITEDVIAETLGISRTTLRNRYGKRTDRLEVAAHRRERAKTLRAQGWSYSEIGREVGITQQAAWSLLAREAA